MSKIRSAYRSSNQVLLTHKTILDVLLSNSSSGPTKSSYFENEFKITGSDVRNSIRYLRRLGYLIEGCAGDLGGYRIVCDPESVIKGLQKRINSMKKTIKDLKQQHKILNNEI